MRSYVVIGLGRFGNAVAEKLYELGNEVMVIDRKQAVISQIADEVTHAVVADATDEDVLRALGVHNYDCAIVCVGSNLASSVLITLNLKELGMGQIVCKAMDESHRKVLEKVGADHVVIPEQEMASRLAMGLSNANILDYIDLSPTYGIAEIRVPRTWIGSTIAELLVRSRYGVDIIGVRRGGEIQLSLGAAFVFAENDIIMVLGDNEHLEMLQKI